MRNRDLSWLQFNHRVLLQADREDVPLLERIKFMKIFSDNMDEFFKVRVGKYIQGGEKIKEVKIRNEILRQSKFLYKERDRIYMRLRKKLKNNGLVKLLEVWENQDYNQNKYPLKITLNESQTLENIKKHNIEKRVYDLLNKREASKPIKLELPLNVPKKLRRYLKQELQLDENQIFVSVCPLEFQYLDKLLKDKRLEHLTYKRESENRFIGRKKEAAQVPVVNEENKSKDILLFHPYCSMDFFLEILKESGEDNHCKSIKITIYRLAQNSKVVEYLINAAKNGIEVTVFIELRARFDELHNLECAQALIKAGCKVYYGVKKYKVHGKACLITKVVDDQTSYICHVGSGNYNEDTTGIYTDVSLISSDKKIGEDLSMFFKTLHTANVEHKYQELVIGPKYLKKMLLDHIIQEMTYGKKGRIILKLNAMNDPQIMEALQSAVEEGVKVDLIIRGICCIPPEILKYKNIRIISVIGRYLEHSRVYVFGVGSRRKIFIASSDLLKRNLKARIEIACPVKEEENQQKIMEMLSNYLNKKIARYEMQKNGKYKFFKGK